MNNVRSSYRRVSPIGLADKKPRALHCCLVRLYKVEETMPLLEVEDNNVVYVRALVVVKNSELRTRMSCFCGP
jgi:hypothetical protein